MVTLDARDVGAPLEDRRTRGYVAEDLGWAVDLLQRTVGRHRFRRGSTIDAANLPGIVALEGEQRVGLLTVLSHRDELEIVVAAAEHGDRFTLGRLLEAAQRHAGADCRRIFVTCYNAELVLLQQLQQHDFRLCAVRPGSITAGVRRSVGSGVIPESIAGVPIRDEVELDHLIL